MADNDCAAPKMQSPVLRHQTYYSNHSYSVSVSPVAPRLLDAVSHFMLWLPPKNCGIDKEFMITSRGLRVVYDCQQEHASRLNHLLEMLSSGPRRQLIRYFESVSQTDTDSVETVVSHLDSRLPSRDRDGLKLALYHTHLPKLEVEGWVDYDARSGEIRYYGEEAAEPLLADLFAVLSQSRTST